MNVEKLTSRDTAEKGSEDDKAPLIPVLLLRCETEAHEVPDGSRGWFYDGFIRDCAELDRTYPAAAWISGYPDAFFVEVCTCSTLFCVSAWNSSAHNNLVYGVCVCMILTYTSMHDYVCVTFENTFRNMNSIKDSKGVLC